MKFTAEEIIESVKQTVGSDDPAKLLAQLASETAVLMSTIPVAVLAAMMPRSDCDCKDCAEDRARKGAGYVLD